MQAGKFKTTYKQTPIEDDYTIGDILGTGNYSVVKSCTHKTTGEKRAVKIINKENAGPKGLKMVQTEVDVMIECQHTNIVRLFEVYETEKDYLLVMQVVAGGELFDRIVKLHSYSEKDASLLVHQMVSALNHLHSHGVVHRDLKPENLLLATQEPQSPVLLADFGLAEYLDPQHPLNVPVGTPGYVAPEVVECLDDDSCTYGKEVDMWAVGVITYILLCGFPPFFSEDDDEVFDQILEGKYDYPSPAWDSISTLAKDLINKLLVLDPKKRFTAGQTLEHPWVKGADVPDHPLEGTLTEMRKFNAQRKWKGAILATMALNRLTSKFAVLAINSSFKELPLPAKKPEETKV